jgi:hypothetical protein
MAKEVTPSEPMLSPDALADMQSFDDAVRALQEAGISGQRIEDYGDGFVVREKEEFVNVPFLIVATRIVPDGDFGPFAVVHLMTRDGRKAILNDGGAGIYQQVLDVTNSGKSLAGAFCERGLTVSNYTYTDEKTNEQRPAKTFYFAGM